MRSRSSSPVRRSVLGQRCRRVLGIDPAQVPLRVDAGLASAGCWALAQHGGIRLAPASLGLPAPALLELIGHELCHVAQQRRARHSGRSSQPAMPASDPLALEAQADAWGRALRDGVPSVDREPLPAAPERALPAIWIEGQRVHHPGELPRPIESVLALIPRATAWFRGAAASRAVELSFPDGPTFLVGVLRGLYATDVMHLRRTGLSIGPRRLLELGVELIDALLSYEFDENANAQPDESLLASLRRRGVLTADQITRCERTLGALGVRDNPLFQVRRLEDLLRLHEAMELPLSFDPPDEMARASARFALDRASTISEFADAVTAFAHIALSSTPAGGHSGSHAGSHAPGTHPKPGSGRRSSGRSSGSDDNGNDDDRGSVALDAVQAQAAMVWELLNETASEWLLAPTLGFPVASAGELAAQLRQHLAFGQPLGFQTPSAGARQVAAYVAHRGPHHVPSVHSVREYIERVQACVADGTIADLTFRQDGMAQRCVARGADGVAILSIDASGCVAIESYGPLVRHGQGQGAPAGASAHSPL